MANINLLALVIFSSLKCLGAALFYPRIHCSFNSHNLTNIDFNSHVIPFNSPLNFPPPIRTAHLFIPSPSDSISTTSLFNIGSTISSYLNFPFERVWITTAPSSWTELSPNAGPQLVPSGTPGRLVLLRPNHHNNDPVSDYVREVFEDEGVRLLQVTLLVGCTDQHVAWLPHPNERLVAESISETDSQLELLSRIERSVESGSLSAAIGLSVHPDWFVIVRLRPHPQLSQLIQSEAADPKTANSLLREPAIEPNVLVASAQSTLPIESRRFRRHVRSEQQRGILDATRVKRVDEKVPEGTDYLTSALDEEDALDMEAEGSGTEPPEVRSSFASAPTLKPTLSLMPNVAPQLLQPLGMLVAYIGEDLVYDLPPRMFFDPDTNAGIAQLRLVLRCEWPCGQKWPNTNVLVPQNVLVLTASPGARGGARLRGHFAGEPYLRSALAAQPAFANWSFTLSAFDALNASAADRFVVQLHERLVVAPPTHAPLSLTTLSDSAELEKDNSPPVYRKGSIDEVFYLYIGMSCLQFSLLEGSTH